MAYKFQLGLASMSGSLVQSGSLTIADDDSTHRFTVNRDSGAVSGSAFTGTSWESDGSVTAGTSFIIGSADLNETDMEKLDGITNGTAAANKAVVLDGSKNIATLGTVGCGAITSTGNSAMAQLTTSGRVIVDDATEATSTTDGSLQTDGGLSVAKSAVIGDDLDLLSDGAIMNIGSTSKFTLTALDANNAVMASANHRLAFGDAGEYIAGDGTDLSIVSSGLVSVTGDTNIVGTLSADTSLTLDTTTITTAEIGVLDSVTPGTAAASKAVVLDASKNIATIGTVGCGAITSTGASTFGTVSGSGLISGKAVTATQAGETSQFAAISGSSTFLCQGAATVGGLLQVSGAMQVDGTVVNFPNVGAASLDTGDLMLSLDATSKDLQARTRANVITDFAGVMAGTVTATALADDTGVLSLDIDNLNAETIATGDTIVFNDDGDNGLHKVTFDNMMTKAMPLVSEAAMAVADDYILFLDGSGTGDGKKEQWADLVSAMAGAGLTATDGVLSSEAASTPNNIGNAAGRMVEGFNYSSVDFDAARTWITPASPSAGDKVIVKAPANADTYTLRVSGGEGSKIDGSASIYMNAPSGSVTLTYLGSDSWAIS